MERACGYNLNNHECKNNKSAILMFSRRLLDNLITSSMCFDWMTIMKIYLLMTGFFWEKKKMLPNGNVPEQQ